jgi:hypothetical protein
MVKVGQIRPTLYLFFSCALCNTNIECEIEMIEGRKRGMQITDNLCKRQISYKYDKLINSFTSIQRHAYRDFPSVNSDSNIHLPWNVMSGSNKHVTVHDALPWRVICVCSSRYIHQDSQKWLWIYEYRFTHSWSWSLLEKQPIVQLLKNFLAFYGTRKFITVFTRALHWSISWARSFQSIPSYLISLRSILILSTHLRLGLPY